MSQPTSLHVRLLGHCRVQYGDQAVSSLEQPRLQVLLAYLLLHRHAPISRQQLASTFWPASTDQQARNNLRSLIYRLRKALPDADLFLALENNTIRWRPDAPYMLDLADFEAALDLAEQSDGPTTHCEALEAAVAVYTGDLLPDCFDEWIVAERERLHRAYLRALEQLVLQLEEQRAYDSAIHYARRLLRIDPLHEATYRRLMRLHLAKRNRTGALQVYHTCAAILRRELGVDPSTDTQALHQQLLEDGADAAVPTASAVEAAVERLASVETVIPLVGRQAEWAHLLGVWRRAAARRPQMALILGEAGMGKTRLAEELLAWVERQGIAAATARCYSLESRLALGPVLQWLRCETLQPRLAMLDPVWRGALARLLPGIESDQPAPSAEHPPDTPDSRWQRQRLFEALARTTLSGGQPLLLFIDDLQWSDQETIDWLHYLLNFDKRARLLIVATARSEEVDENQTLAALRLVLTREGRLSELTVPPLIPDETTALAGHVSNRRLSPSESTRLHQDTQGNPLFIVETVRAALVSGLLTSDPPTSLPLPSKVQAVIRYRLGQLSPAVRRLTESSAIIGREFSVELLGLICQQNEDALVHGLDELWRRKIVHEQGQDTYDFSHDKLRQVVCAELSPLLRRTLHHRAAQALEAIHAETLDEVADQLGRHYDEAGMPDKAVDYWMLAGDRARTLYAHEEAVAHYERALAIIEAQGDHERTARTLMKLGLTHHDAFQFEASRQAFDRATQLWQQIQYASPAVRLAPAPHALRVVDLSPLTLDPCYANDASSCGVIDNLFSGLVSLDQAWSLIPGVAQNWQVLDDGLIYEFQLRDDATWSDGRPLMAMDFVHAIRRLLDPAIPDEYRLLPLEIKNAQTYHQGETTDFDRIGVKTLDPLTLQIELAQPASYFLHLLTQIYPIPSHVVAQHGENWTDPEHMVSNGPFQLKAWQANRQIVLRRNPRYHGRFLGNIEEVVLKADNDLHNWLGAYEADELDAVRLYSNVMGPAVMGRVRQQYAAEYRQKPEMVTACVGFDVTRPPFDDILVRRAFGLAVDWDVLDITFDGAFLPATGGYLPPGMPGHSPGIGLPFDPELARQLLAEAGYPAGRGFPRLTAPVPGGAIGAFEAASDMWRDVLQVDVTWQSVDFAELNERFTNDPPALWGYGDGGVYPDPHSLSLAGPLPDWHNEDYYSLLDQARRTTDQATRLDLYRQADRIVVEEAPILPFFYTVEHLLVKPWVRRYRSEWRGWHEVIIKPH